MADTGFNPYTAADTLQNILAQKRMEQRQSMLDALDVQKTQSQIANQQASTEWLGEQRQGMAALRQAQAKNIQDADNTKFLNNTPAGTVDPTLAGKLQAAGGQVQTTGGATLPSAQLSGMAGLPGAAPIQATPPLTTIQAPSVPDASIPTTQNYLGGPVYQQSQARKSYLQGLAADPAFADPKLQAGLKLAEAYPDQANAIMSDLTRTLLERQQDQQPTKSALLLPDNTFRLDDGTISKGLPPGYKEVRGFEPQRPEKDNWTLGQIPDPDTPPTVDNPHPTKTIFYNQSHPNQRMDAGGITRPTPPPKVDPTAGGLYNKDGKSAWSALQKARELDPNKFPTRPQEVDTAQRGVIRTVTNPDVQKDLNDIWNESPAAPGTNTPQMKAVKANVLFNSGRLAPDKSWSAERQQKYIQDMNQALRDLRPGLESQ